MSQIGSKKIPHSVYTFLQKLLHSTRLSVPLSQVGDGQSVPHCGTQIPHSFDSYGREVQVNFKYGVPASGFTGFQLQYSVAGRDCRNNVHSF